MRRLVRTLVPVIAALALGGCAAYPVEEDPPHHFSKDRYGNRVACYATEVADEYECVQVYRRYAYTDPYPYYGPFGYAGFHYGWPYYYPPVVVVPERPAPNPPPPHWRRRR